MQPEARQRPRILFLTHRLPWKPDRGDRIRAYHELRALSQSCDVDLLSLAHDAEEASHALDVVGLADRVAVARIGRARNLLRATLLLPSRTPLTHALLDSSRIETQLQLLVGTKRPDVVLAFCSSMARVALAPPLRDVPLLLDLVDVDSEKWAALASTSSWPKSWVYAREAYCLRRFERFAARAARVTFVVNHREAALMRSVAGEAPQIEVLENGVDFDRLSPPGPPSLSQDVVFCGVMNYEPNEQGALWLAQEVWPLVQPRWPASRLILLGSRPTPRLRHLPAVNPSLVVTGAVDDVRPWLWNAAVSAAPLQVARGIQNKVLEAVAAGLPTVVTPSVADGLPREVMPACLVADSPSAFAEALDSLLRCGPRQRRHIAESARMDSLGWETKLTPLIDYVHRECRG